MAGLYVHIPFCKQACIYCDFHFSTSLKYRNRMVSALVQEIELQKDFSYQGPLESIYFGGGTPTVLEVEQLDEIIRAVSKNFEWVGQPEITLEANPDDLSPEKIARLARSKVNRLSIGIQSFRDEDLRMMNRSHNREQALKSVAMAMELGFENITADLIYGIPGMDNPSWEQQIDQLLELGVPHLSSYALTVEPKTVLHHKIQKREIAAPSEEQAAVQFEILWKKLENAGYEHYEVSNFAKPGYRAVHNSSYWKGTPYLGIGPSAHSYYNNQRFWNVSNNMAYMKSVEGGKVNRESEQLSDKDRFNEMVMTGLRTKVGLSLSELNEAEKDFLLKEAEPALQKGQLVQSGEHLFIPQHWRFHSDGIAASLFYI